MRRVPLPPVLSLPGALALQQQPASTATAPPSDAAAVRGAAPAPIDVDGAKLEIMTLHGRLDRQTDETRGKRGVWEGTTATCQTDRDEG